MSAPASPVSSDPFSAILVLVLSLTLVSTVLHTLRVPTLVGFILTGVLIGPTGLGWVTSVPAMQLISEFGVMFLLFTLGLEISLQEVRRVALSLLRFGLPQVLMTIFLGAPIFQYLFDFSLTHALFFGALISLSSTAAVFKLMLDNRDMDSAFGRVNTHILVFQDIAALPMMAVVPFMAGTPQANSDGPVLLMVKIVGFLATIGFLGLRFIPAFFDRVVRTGSRELFFFFVISILLGVSWLSHKVGLSFSLGAFLAGILLSESPYNRQVLAELTPLRDNFLGLFFASVGMLLEPAFVLQSWQSFLIYIPVLFVVKSFIIYSAVRFNRMPHGTAAASALSLSQVGEFSFVLATAAYSAKVISGKDFQIFLSLAVLSLIMTPFFYAWAQKLSAHSGFQDLTRLFSRSRKRETEMVTPESLVMPASKSRRVLVIGLGHAGKNALRILRQVDIEGIGLDVNANSVKECREKGFTAFYGDATRVEVLEKAGIAEVDLAVVALTGKDVTARVVATLHAIRPQMPVVVRTQYLRDLTIMPRHGEHRFVVAELQTSKAILADVLSYYEVPELQIRVLLNEVKESLRP
ncbi:MAG: cation:proton antiporter [Bdellovibrionaceae bacterium]|nr:cation:proton antiporter [Pseudobdellovibrionaceae bacterium]